MSAIAPLGHGYPFPLSLSRVEGRPALVTNGGRHTAEAWAAHVAEWFLSPAPGNCADRHVFVDLAETVLIGVFRATAKDEKAQLAAEGGSRLDALVDRASEACAAILALRDAAVGTVAETYWSRWDIAWAASIELAHHLRSADFAERSWWADEHPLNNAAAAFKARHFPE